MEGRSYPCPWPFQDPRERQSTRSWGHWSEKQVSAVPNSYSLPQRVRVSTCEIVPESPSSTTTAHSTHRQPLISGIRRELPIAASVPADKGAISLDSCPDRRPRRQLASSARRTLHLTRACPSLLHTFEKPVFECTSASIGMRPSFVGSLNVQQTEHC